MRSDKSLDANTALPQNIIKSSLRQEVVRRLLNIHPDVGQLEVFEILNKFYDKLRFSGHQHSAIALLFIEGLLKFNSLVKRSQLPISDKSYRPLYMSNSYDKVNRGIKRYLSKYKWFSPDDDVTNNAWKLEVPRNCKSDEAT